MYPFGLVQHRVCCYQIDRETNSFRFNRENKQQWQVTLVQTFNIIIQMIARSVHRIVFFLTGQEIASNAMFLGLQITIKLH